MAEAYNHSQISNTAKFGAFLRGESDIPLSREISCLTGAEAITRKLIGEDLLSQVMWTGPLLEGRYKILDHYLNQNPGGSVLEYGCAFFPRKVLLPAYRFYLGFDLPGVVAERAKVFAELGIADLKTHEDVACNILDTKRVLSKVRAHFPKEREIDIIHETLMPHFTFDEKRKIMDLNHEILEEYGGRWVNVDILTREKLRAMQEKKPAVMDLMAKLNGITGRSFYDNAYENDAHAQEELARSRLKVDIQDFPIDNIHLSTCEALGIPREKILPLMKSRKAWIITV